MRNFYTFIFLFALILATGYSRGGVSQTSSQDLIQEHDNMIENARKRSIDDARLSFKMDSTVVFLIIVVAVSCGSFVCLKKVSKKRSFTHGTTRGKVVKVKKTEKHHHRSTKRHESYGHLEGDREDKISVKKTTGNNDAPKDDKIVVRVKYGISKTDDSRQGKRNLKKVRSRKRKST